MFIGLLVFFQGVTDGSASFQSSSGTESWSIFELGFKVCCRNLRATFFTGFFVALPNPGRRAVETPITRYQLSRLDNAIIF